MMRGILLQELYAKMAGCFLRRSVPSLSTTRPLVSSICNRYSQSFSSLYRGGEENTPSTLDKSSRRDSCVTSPSDKSNILQLSPLLSCGKDQFGSFDIEVVDPDLWQVSSGISHSLRTTDGVSRKLDHLNESVERSEEDPSNMDDDHDFDEIEDMRLRGNLFYKLDKGSLEFEEYNINFHRKKTLKKEKLKQAKIAKEGYKEKIINSSVSNRLKPTKNKNKCSTSSHYEKESSKVEACGNSATTPPLEGKKKRTPTFNQLTDPYHLPFCLDIFISKSSVRACIVHRVTSKVVTVAHSISKDMKFDLASTKDATACAAVGGILAQRAIADDIHNVVYTPRKGEKLEGKLQIVLQSIIDNGIDVKVKIKQKKPVKSQISLESSY